MKALFIAVCAVVLTSAPAETAPVKYIFTGTVTFVDLDLSDVFDTSMTLFGSFTYDDSTPGSLEPGLSQEHGFSNYPEKAFGSTDLVMRLGSYTASSPFGNDQNGLLSLIQVTNNYPDNTSGKDRFTLTGQLTGAPLKRFDPHAGIFFDDSSQSSFFTTDLAAVGDLTGWTGLPNHGATWYLAFSYSGGSPAVAGSITSITRVTDSAPPQRVSFKGLDWTNVYSSNSIGLDAAGALSVFTGDVSVRNRGGASRQTSTAIQAASEAWAETTFMDTGTDPGPQLTIQYDESPTSVYFASLGASESQQQYAAMWRHEFHPPQSPSTSVNVGARSVGTHTVRIGRLSDGRLEFWLDGRLVETSGTDAFPASFNVVSLVAAGLSQGQVATFTDYQDGIGRPGPLTVPNVTLFTNESDWQSASSDIKTVGFEGLAPIGKTQPYTTSSGLTIDGVTFTGPTPPYSPIHPSLITRYYLYVVDSFYHPSSYDWGSGPVLAGPPVAEQHLDGGLGSRIRVTMPSGVTSVSADLMSFLEYASPFKIVVSTSTGSRDITVNSFAHPERSFIGFVTDSPILFVDYYAQAGFPLLDNFSFGQAADRTSPLTVVVPSPGPNGAGWNRTEVALAVSAADPSGGSGVKRVQVSLTGAQTGTVTNPSAPVVVSAEGTTTATYFAEDNAGNVEAPKTVVIRIDRTPPEFSTHFDPRTLDIAVFGVDELSGVPAGPVHPSVVPRRIGWHSAPDWDGSEAKGAALQLRRYDVVDAAGNQTAMWIRVSPRRGQDHDHDSHRLDASITALQYGDNAAQVPSPNELSFRAVAFEKGSRLRHVTQTLRVTTGEQHRVVEGAYNATRGLTTIRDGHGSIVRAGLVLLRLDTSRGTLSVQY